MARRDWPMRMTCGHPGCTETVTYRYDRLKDLQTSFERKHYWPDKWRCTRHAAPNEVLSAANPTTEATLVVDQREYGHYFGQQVLVFGPGFKAFAKDFPPGTRLIVTARIEFPETHSS